LISPVISQESQNALAKEVAKIPIYLHLAEMAGRKGIEAKETEKMTKCGLFARFFAEKVTKYNKGGIATPLKVLFNLYGENRWQLTQILIGMLSI